jgi:hypothetical protein
MSMGLFAWIGYHRRRRPPKYLFVHEARLMQENIPDEAISNKPAIVQQSKLALVV